MGYSLYIIDAETRKPIHTEEAHLIRGGTYEAGGSTELWLTVTYNYYEFFKEVLGESGLNIFDGMTIRDSLPILFDAYFKLKGQPSNTYWDSTEGNAKEALKNMIMLALLAPSDTIWEVT